ncbi:hypothetical protein [Salinicola sp. NYA28a]
MLIVCRTKAPRRELTVIGSQYQRVQRVEMPVKMGCSRRSASPWLVLPGMRSAVETESAVRKCSLAVIGEVSALASRNQVEDTLNGDGFGSVTDRNYLAEEEVWQASGTWQDGENITAGIDLANQLNSLVAQNGLSAGDVITVKVEGAGGTRYIEAAGGDRTAPTLAITMADYASINQSSNDAAYMLGNGELNETMSVNSDVDDMSAMSISDEVGLLGINESAMGGEVL